VKFHRETGYPCAALSDLDGDGRVLADRGAGRIVAGIEDMDTGVTGLIATVVGADVPVVAGDRRARAYTLCANVVLGAELAVIARSGVVGVGAEVVFAANVISADVPVIAICVRLAWADPREHADVADATIIGTDVVVIAITVGDTAIRDVFQTADVVANGGLADGALIAISGAETAIRDVFQAADVAHASWVLADGATRAISSVDTASRDVFQAADVAHASWVLADGATRAISGVDTASRDVFQAADLVDASWVLADGATRAISSVDTASRDVFQAADVADASWVLADGATRAISGVDTASRDVFQAADVADASWVLADGATRALTGVRAATGDGVVAAAAILIAKSGLAGPRSAVSGHGTFLRVLAQVPHGGNSLLADPLNHSGCLSRCAMFPCTAYNSTRPKQWFQGQLLHHSCTH